MNTRHRRVTSAWRALGVLCCAAPLHAGAAAPTPTALTAPTPAAPAAPTLAPAATPAPPGSPAAPDKTEPGEPAVVRTVVEDDGARIDELKVRGQTKRITVTPKFGGIAYEIIPPSDARDLSQGARGSNGAVGKRVWPVLSF